MADPDNNALAPYYYRDNFLRLCETVEAQYGDLLLPAERVLLQRFRRLEFRAQCLYVRLISRLGPWFREDKLAYPELGRTGPLLDALIEQDMVQRAEALSLQELGKLYTREELQQAFGRELGEPRFRDKRALLVAIEALSLPAAEPLQRLTAAPGGRVIAACGLEQVQLLQLLFFGNRRQSLTEFVLSDLGVARHFPYALDRAYRLFTERPAVEEYLLCAAFSDTWYAWRDAGEMDTLPALAAEMLAVDIVYPSSEGCWHRLCNAVARELERQGHMDDAFRLYGRSRRHPARERRTRVLESIEDWEGAIALCEEIISDPWCEEEREAADRILPRVRRKLHGGRMPRRRDAFAETRLSLSPGEAPVELLAADSLMTQWRAVHYVENKLMNALFGLAFWEQIFAPVPGAFHNPYQSVPTDMYQPAFRLHRRDALATRLTQLRNANLARELAAAYRAYRPYRCRWVDWRYFDEQLLEAVTRIVPREHLLAIWERILFDPGENRRGFPDLIALGQGPGDYCLIEVKGPGDALQNGQKRWLRYFAQQGIPAQVAWVEWAHD